MSVGKIQIQTVSPFKKFVLYFSITLILLFLLLYFEHFSPLFFINQWQTDLTVYLTKTWIDFFNLPLFLNDATVYYQHGLELQILNDCNGLVPFLFTASALLAFPSSMNKKIYWLFISYLVILFINTIRIDAILYHVIAHPENFKFVHEIVGRYLMASVALLLFYFFSKKAVEER